MGVVLLAFDPDLDRKVALKILRADVFEGEAEGRARLIAEAQAMARLQHPHVVAVHEIGFSADRAYVVMEYVEGTTLRAWLGERPRSWREALDLLTDAGAGLAAAHRAGIVHRDFKPENVLVGIDGRPRVADFGLAAAASHIGASPALSFAGTVPYMPPEQLDGGSAGARSDQFAFGVVLWEALYGVRPFGGETVDDRRAAIAAGPKPPARRNLPDRLRAAITRALAPDPAERWPSMDAFLDELRRDRRGGRTWLAIGAAVAVTVAASAFVVGRWAAAGDPCAGGATLAASVWDPAARARVESAFLATGHADAADVFARVDAALRDATDGWARAHRDTCQATYVRHEQSEALLDLRMRCLERTRAGLTALVAALSRDVDATTIQKAQLAVGELADVSPCADVASLAAAVPLPRDPARRAEIDGLFGEVDRLEADLQLGRYAVVRGAAADLLERARAKDFAPVLARALFVIGDIMTRTAELAAGIEMLFEAAEVAGAAHDDRTAARALVALIVPLGAKRGHPEEGAHIILLALGALARAGNDPQLLVRLLATAGSFEQSRHQLLAALGYEYTAVELERVVNGPDTARVGRYLSEISTIERPLHLYHRADEHARAGLAILERRLGPDHPQTIVGILNASTFDYELGDYAAARAEMETLLPRAERAYGKENTLVGSVASNLAEVRLQLGDRQDVRALAERALTIRGQQLGPETVPYAQVLGILAELELAEGQVDRALAGLRRDVAIIEKKLGPTDPRIAPELTSLACTELAAGHVPAARAILERAHAIYETARQLDDPDAGVAMSALADVEIAEGHCADAVRTAERARTTLEAKREPDHPDCIAARLTLARADTCAGAPAQAIPILEHERATIEARRLGPVLLARVELALAQARLAADPGHARVEAVALARAARARVAEAGFVLRVAEIDAWLNRVEPVAAAR
jgi:hypothetical protein